MTGTGRRIAVVLFNLGGPDGPEAVRPFLRNLFSDRAIIDAPLWVRAPLASFISRVRQRSAIANYALMGGGSPILENTRAQASALELWLMDRLLGADVRVFVCMRYWKPSATDVAKAVTLYGPDDIVLAPLYPQFSTTTTASSLNAWKQAYRGQGECRAMCCWYDNPGLVEAHLEGILRTWRAAGSPKVRLLFSAHGLPERIALSGDPYQWQIEKTCAEVGRRLGPEWDWAICYQSRVGPLKWIAPSTPEAIETASREGLGVLIDPIAFVSEHIETLVELDQDYAELARRMGAPCYLRVPTVSTSKPFIEGLGNGVIGALGRHGDQPDGAPCPRQFSRCGRSK